MPRLFVAVWPPDDVLDTLAALRRPPAAGVKWTVREQWHVTLRFLGHLDDAGAVAEALAAVAPSVAATEVLLGPAVGRYGRRILHVPVAGLDEPAAAVIAATARLGRPPDDRRFSGHITLARVARGARCDLRELTGEAVSAKWHVGEFCLVESQLSPEGARYQVAERFRLS